MPFRVESSDVLVDEFDELVSDVNAAPLSFVDFSDIVMSAGLVLGDFVSDLVSVESFFAQFGRFVEESIRFDAIESEVRNADQDLTRITGLQDYSRIDQDFRDNVDQDFQDKREDQTSERLLSDKIGEDGFSNISGFSELERAAQRLLRALESVLEVSREDISVQVAVEGAALMRLDNQERAESEHAARLQDIAVELRQLEVEFEQEKTRITREEVEKRTELNERAAQERIENVKRETEAHLQLTDGVAPGGVLGESFEQTQDFISLTDGVVDSVQRFETSIYVFSALFRREFTQVLQSGVAILDDFRESLRAPRLAALAEDVRESDVLSRLEEGQPARDERTAERFAAGAARFRSAEVREDRRALSFFDSLSPDVQRAIESYREERAVELGTDIPEQLSQVRTASDSFSGGAGDLVAAVPLDVVDAVTDIVQVRRDANAELVILEQEAAAEIQIIQESVTLTAENKAKAIERIERDAALRRIRIENEVSQKQRASFQSVVTNFLSGVGKMIAAEAQLALARRATNAISGLLGGVSGGASLFSSVLLPLFGGLSLAYGASKLIAPSSPSADVYERSQFGVSGEGANRNVQTPGLTRAEQETDSPVLEANINVNVEASGTRLGQANERVKLKTERWGG